jgi:hypothetical protein
MSDQPVGCARPTGATVGAVPASEEKAPLEPQRKEVTMLAKVGGKAPDFQAPTYYRGTFSSIKLSDYLGKWVLLCFYPGDFTFV